MISATKIILGLLSAFSLTSIVSAQSDQIPAKPQQKQVALVNARIYTAVPGQATIERGYVIFDKGVITAVGAGDAPTLAGVAKNLIALASPCCQDLFMWAASLDLLKCSKFPPPTTVMNLALITLKFAHVWP